MKIFSMDKNYIGPWEDASPVTMKASAQETAPQQEQPIERDHPLMTKAEYQAVKPQANLPIPNEKPQATTNLSELTAWEEVAPFVNKQPAAAKPTTVEQPGLAQSAYSAPETQEAVEPVQMKREEQAQPDQFRKEEQKPSNTQTMVGGNLKGASTGKDRWCEERTIAGCANHWMPDEVSMTRDIFQWKNGQIAASEQKAVKRALGFFSTADSLAANNIVLGLMRHMTNKKARRYMIRQAYEEAIHTHTYQHIVQSLGLDEKEIFNAYHEVPTIMAKDQFVTPFIDVLTDPDFKANTLEQKRTLLKSVMMFAGVMEGLFFYAGFANIFALKNDNKMVGTAKQIAFITRDETLHSQFGMDVALTIMQENPGIVDAQFKAEMISLFEKAVSLEVDYINEMCSERSFSINPDQQIQYVKFIMNRRCQKLGFEKIYDLPKDEKGNDISPLPWMSAALDLKQEQNFFEGEVMEYRGADNIDWEDTEDKKTFSNQPLAMGM